MLIKILDNIYIIIILAAKLFVNMIQIINEHNIITSPLQR